ncbi:uncharacterized protein A1O5_00577 [Cladophialophora psammophila CBS 110553]|uniref:Uncharacterized protein n=1 Tax=Cladophialophora psammophila CBS 110553 TaxID=1182543 RepID=W9Y0P5_9EURO|nr:uncharacterized protein A1O5_00577 [Cladophialophora psammophila CBS 110553]EXJ76069.1 hypothetical protein A1O5_00577 [Cladophialophora psammophila CBS 110553]
MSYAKPSSRYYADYERALEKAVERPRLSPPSSAPSSRTSSATSLQPTSPVAEWCHQMHLIQKRKYDWCTGCYPKPPPVPSTVKIPSQKVLQQSRMGNEPGHAYQ